MAERKVTYKEPASYFTPGMLKAAREYDREKAAKEKAAAKAAQKKSGGSTKKK